MNTRSYGRTLAACYLGYVTQAICVNLLPLLFVTFRQEFSFSLEQISLLMVMVFAIQIGVDLLATRFSRYMRFRSGSVSANIFAVLGLMGLSFLPDVIDPYAGVMLSATFLAVGGGLVETMVSPIVDALPGERKTGAMSLLHSFYCWGFMAVVLLSTLFFVTVGTAGWRWLVLLWAIPPAATGVLFLLSPMPPRPEEGEGGVLSLRQLFSHRTLWLFLLLMLCSGATELGIAQWASLFAETGLQVPKTVGDLLGPCAFAALQGLSRLFFGAVSRRMPVYRLLLCFAVGCVGSMLLVVLAPTPLLSLIGVALCGVCVGPMWPGLLSLSSARYPGGGTAMFSLLAFCGDVGCTAGPAVVGMVSDWMQAKGASLLVSLRGGIGLSILFPLVLALGLGYLCVRRHRKNVPGITG